MSAVCSNAKLATFGTALSGTAVQHQRASGRRQASFAVQAADQKYVTKVLKAAPKKPTPPPKKAATVAKPAGTVSIGKAAGTTVRGGAGTISRGGTVSRGIEMFTGDKSFRTKSGSRPAPKILARVEQLRLLSKAEQSGLLSALEKQGLTLSAIESSGLLSTAEKFGLISAASDRNTPGALFTLATLLLAAGPALVYFVPDTDPALVALQVLGAVACVAGGSAAYGGATLLASLQK